MYSFTALEPKPEIIHKSQIHNDRVAEAFKSSCIVVSDKIVLSVLVVFLVFEGEPHTEDALCGIWVAAVCCIDVLVGDLFVILRDKVQLVGRRFDDVANCIRLNEVHGRDQVGDLLNHTDQCNLHRSGLHMAAFHLDVQDRNQHFLGRGAAMHKVLSAAGNFKDVVANRERYDLGIAVSKNIGHLKRANTFAQLMVKRP